MKYGKKTFLYRDRICITENFVSSFVSIVPTEKNFSNTIEKKMEIGYNIISINEKEEYQMFVTVDTIIIEVLRADMRTADIFAEAGLHCIG